MAPPRTFLRIAILECDTPIGRAREKYGGYGNLFTELLERSAQLAGVEKIPELDIRKYDVVSQEVYPDLQGVDGILLTGSKWNAFDDDPWILKLVEFVKGVLEDGRVRLVGVCFGHQIIGRALGVKVGRNERGWEVAVTDVELTSKGREVFGIDSLAIHQMHRDIVFHLPPNTSEIENLGFTNTCEVQGMYKKGKLITVQGHPEFYEGIMEDIINSRHDMGIFDQKMYEDGMSKCRKEHDGVAVAAAFVRFLVED